MNRSPWRLLAIISLLLGAAGASHADWLYYGGSPQHTGVASETLTAPLSVVWKYAAIIQKPVTNTSSPVVVGNTVYFVATDRVYAVRADTGELIWKTPSGDQPGPTTYYSTPVVANGLVYVGAANGHMYALDARNGAQRWEYITLGGAPIRSHPLVEDNTLYFGADDDYFYAIDATTAELRWRYHATADIESASTFAPDSTELIYFSSSDGHLYGLNRTTGKLKWSARTTAASGSNSPVAFQNALYLAAGDQIFSFRTRSGISESLIQSSPAEAPEGDITCTPVFAPDPQGDPTRPVVFFGDRTGNFYCYQKSRLYWKRVWKQTLDGGVDAMPVMSGNVIYAAANKGFVYALNELDGSILWQYHTIPTLDLQSQFKYFNMDSPLVVSNGHLLVLGDDGSLNAFGPDGIDFAGPVLTQPRPNRGSMINGLPPLNIGAYLWDDGSGVNPQTIQVTLDGRRLEMSKLRYSERRTKSGVIYDPVQRRIMYNSPDLEPGQTATALQNGRHTVRIDAADWKGNASTLEWSFVVDNSLPVRPRVQPGQNGQPGTPGYGAPGTPGYPNGYGNPGYGNANGRVRPVPRRPPLRGQPGYGQPGYGRPGYGYPRGPS